MKENEIDEESEIREVFEFILKARKLGRKNWVPFAAYKAIVEKFCERLEEG